MIGLDEYIDTEIDNVEVYTEEWKKRKLMSM